MFRNFLYVGVQTYAEEGLFLLDVFKEFLLVHNISCCVILSETKNLYGISLCYQILHCVQNDRFVLKFTFFQSFRIFRYNQVVNAVLDVSVHKGAEVVDGIVDAMVGDTSLRIVVGTDLGRTVAC